MSRDAKDDNTYLLDTESPAEMARLINQERLLTQAMNGPLMGLPDPSTFHHVLDLGCGPGGMGSRRGFFLPRYRGGWRRY